jgi:hypothetical protein
LINCSGDWLYEVVVERYQSPKVAAKNILEMAKTYIGVLENLFKNSDLPEKVSRKKERSLYHNLVWLAWNFYQAQEYQLMNEYLQKSLAYTNCFWGEAISDWVDIFRTYSLNYGSHLNTYKLDKFSNLSSAAMIP